jgi:hypothetical protein
MADQIIQNPTYMEHVRHFFDDQDLEHMFNRGVDLTTYPSLRSEAARVYQVTRPPNAFMPPDAERHWSAERRESFRNWITNGSPLGFPQPQLPQPGSAGRIRKDARSLSEDELETVRRAFQGIIDRDPDDETSYFHLAGLHWFPAPSECLHHEDRYHMWHRAYLRLFEDALRSVPGCEDVTLPYWDITGTPPDFLSKPPFDSYTLPRDVHANYPAGHVTSRYTADEIAANVVLYGIPGHIQAALTQFDWGTFTQRIEVGGHDNGHVASGDTLSTPDIAAFDPIFWFFHSNWDRLWWEWQQIMRATTKWSFRTTITSGQTEFLTDPFNVLPPFLARADEVIDIAATGVGYALPAGLVEEDLVAAELRPAAFGSTEASRNVRVRSEPLVSVRLKGIERLDIPGSFHAVLSADGEPIARQAFFQSTEPRGCSACRDKAVIDLTFEVPADAVLGRALTADIEILAPGAERMGRRFPLSRCGDPTLNVRLLLEEAL